MIWPLCNTVLLLALIFFLVHDLIYYREAHIFVERIGQGVLGGSAVMRIAAWWDPVGPFENWSATLFLAGLVMCAGGRWWRNRRHAVNNERQVRIADEHFAAKARRSL
jgi:hypothetical protein